VLTAEIRAPLRGLTLDLALEVEAGECLALVGPSGSGKTSALRVIAGLHRPEDGLIVCAGEVWLDTDGGIEEPPERRRCGFVFQDYALFGTMSVWRNVAYGLRERNGERRREAAIAALRRFEIAALADARPATLSGGERQRVALARALACGPRALLLDEPLAALDASTRSHAARQLRVLMAEAGVPSILVTHDFDEAGALADRVAVLEAGRIVQAGPAADLAAAPASAFVADLIGAIVLRGHARARPDGLTEIELDGGGSATSTETGRNGPVAVTLHPWEITLEPGPAAATSSARNRIQARVESVVAVGNRVRVALDGPQPLVAEITPEAVRELGLTPGVPVVATWKASATKLVER
jgi:molybdate transport system ATP-binding protein